MTWGVVWFNVLLFLLSADLFRLLLMGLWLLNLFWNAEVPCCWNVVFVNWVWGSVTLIDLRISGFLRMLGSVNGAEKSPAPGWNSGVVFGWALKRLSPMCCVPLFGGSTTQSGDSGRLGPECSATVFSQLGVILVFDLDWALSVSSTVDPDALVLPLVSLIWGYCCCSSASAFFRSLSTSGSRCRRRSSCSCSFMASRSFSIWYSWSLSCCSASCLAIRFSSSFRSTSRCLDQRDCATLLFLSTPVGSRSLRRNLNNFSRWIRCVFIVKNYSLVCIVFTSSSCH